MPANLELAMTHRMPLIAVATLLIAGGHLCAETFDADGVKIHYEVSGDGPAVVLIHGLVSSVDLNWKYPGVIAELAKDHRVIAFDLPGHGKSGKPADPDAYGLAVVEDVVLLMDHLKVKKAHVVGYSMGGIVALKFASQHPQRTLSVTLGGMGWLQEGGIMHKFWEGVSGRDKKNAAADFLHGVPDLALTEDELKKIVSPVKVIIGDRDSCKGLYVEPLQRIRKDWPVVEIKDAGHITCILKPQFKREIADWLRAKKKP